jgi:hypothetical protein
MTNNRSPAAVEAFGYYLPWVLTGGSISAIGYGLFTLLSPATTTAQWIGYQMFYGIGSGSMAAGVSLLLHFEGTGKLKFH